MREGFYEYDETSIGSKTSSVLLTIYGASSYSFEMKGVHFSNNPIVGDVEWNSYE